MADERQHGHRGGNRTWLLRSLILLGIAAEAVTAYVAMEVLVTSQSLAVGLSALTAAVGTVMACILANRRLNGLGVPVTIRILEGIFVAVLTVLRYESLSVQGAGYLAAAGAAGLAALISALGLLGIEEIVVETHTFGTFVGTLRASWLNWRWTSAVAGLAATEAAAETAAGKLQRHYLEYLLRTEGWPLADAQERATALRAAVTGSEGMSTASAARGVLPLCTAGGFNITGCASLGATVPTATAAVHCRAARATVLIVGAHRNAPAPSLDPAVMCQLTSLASAPGS